MIDTDPPANGAAAPLANGTNGAPRGDGRGPDGKFAQGNECAKGRVNAFARHVGELRRAFIEASTPEKLRRLVEALYQKAEAGDLAAAKLLLTWTLGRPGEAVNPDELDLAEYRLLREWPYVLDAKGDVQRMDPGAAAEALVRGALLTAEEPAPKPARRR
jgi:hypothetical protein